MKPVDFFKISAISYVHRKMNIPKNYYTGFDFSKKNNSVEWEDPLKQGKEISVEDENFSWDENGFIYGGQRVRLYIRDRMSYLRNSTTNSLPRYHLTWCKTLQTQHNRGQYQKYVISTSTDDLFLINWVDGQKIVDKSYERLCVCKNCLSKLRWKGYGSDYYTSKEVFKNFSIDEFFAEYNDDNESQFAYLPDDTDITAPPNIYPNDWKIISTRLRTGHLYCTKCNRQFTFQDKGKLHVHHRNGIKNDCSPSNLVVLCAKCHQEEHPEHQISLW